MNRIMKLQSFLKIYFFHFSGHEFKTHWNIGYQSLSTLHIKVILDYLRHEMFIKFLSMISEMNYAEHCMWSSKKLCTWLSDIFMEHISLLMSWIRLGLACCTSKKPSSIKTQVFSEWHFFPCQDLLFSSCLTKSTFILRRAEECWEYKRKLSSLLKKILLFQLFCRLEKKRLEKWLNIILS